MHSKSIPQIFYPKNSPSVSTFPIPVQKFQDNHQMQLTSPTHKQSQKLSSVFVLQDDFLLMCIFYDIRYCTYMYLYHLM